MWFGRMNPTDSVKAMVGEKVRIEMKGGEVLEGILESVDSYINLLLSDTSDLGAEGERKLGEVVVRGNNIVFIKPVR